MSESYADIIIDISHEKVDRPFQYRIPESMLDKLQVGMCVEIPFGKGNTLREGYVIDITDKTDYPAEKIKEIHAISEKNASVHARYIKLAWWIKTHYGSTMIAALKVVLAARQKAKALETKLVSLRVDREQAVELRRVALSKKQNGKARLLEALLESDEVSQSMLTAKLGVSAQTIRSLEQQCVIKIETFQSYRNPIGIRSTGCEKKELTIPQQQIVDDFLRRYDEGDKRPSLLHGVTGSGKTEVYLGIIEGILERGKQCIVLIPEIALTYQTLLRFYRRFGEVVSILNSRMTPAQKYDQHERAKNGEVKIMIGPRSALFVPFPDLGLILIDEEHESSYKSEAMPRYHAREVAVKLAQITDAAVFMGSATPSLDAYAKTENGEFCRYELSERIGGATPAEVFIADLRSELKAGNYSIFSRRLKQAMEDRLEKKEQIMLFLNRRGLAGFVSCRACGTVLKCPHCDVSLSEHRSGMICHYCGYQTAKPAVCPECGSKYLSGFRAGTQQVEEAVLKQFPAARVLRMDADTTRHKDDYEKILAEFASEEADILIGTQMIVKGHDFPNVTLVGILAADLSLAASDYRCGERTFQLLVQAAGRAGRAQKPGEAIIQTYQPEHYSIQLASAQDYRAFFELEYAHRQLMDYPPAFFMLAVLFLGRDEATAERVAAEITQQVKTKDWMQTMQIRLIGPAPASIGKINDVFRRVSYFKASRELALVQVKNEIEEYLSQKPQLGSKVTVYFDFNPMNGF